MAKSFAWAEYKINLKYPHLKLIIYLDAYNYYKTSVYIFANICFIFPVTLESS